MALLNSPHHRGGPYIVAEIGQNHCGSVTLAKELVRMAVRCGVDCVKFQFRNRFAEYTLAELAAPHPRLEHAYGESYGDHRAALDLTIEQLKEIQNYTHPGVDFVVTPCFAEGVYAIETYLDPPWYKVASKDLRNLGLLREIKKTGKPVMLSTGKLRKQEHLEQALEVLPDAGLMQCTSQYPCKEDNVHLWGIRGLEAHTAGPVGYSDHTVGIKAGPAAVALGAKVVEKHITLNRKMKGTDHAASLEEEGLWRYVRDCREVHLMCGDRRIDSYIVPLGG